MDKTKLITILTEIDEGTKTPFKAYNEILSLYSVSKSVSTEYAEFCVICDRKGLPLICLEDYIKQYCC